MNEPKTLSVVRGGCSVQRPCSADKRLIDLYNAACRYSEAKGYDDTMAAATCLESAAEAFAESRDSQRLDWLQRHQVSVGYNVEAQAWGVDFEAPLKATIREAIDAAIASPNDRPERPMR